MNQKYFLQQQHMILVLRYEAEDHPFEIHDEVTRREIEPHQGW